MDLVMGLEPATGWLQMLNSSLTIN